MRFNFFPQNSRNFLATNNVPRSLCPNISISTNFVLVFLTPLMPSSKIIVYFPEKLEKLWNWRKKHSNHSNLWVQDTKLYSWKKNKEILNTIEATLQFVLKKMDTGILRVWTLLKYWFSVRGNYLSNPLLSYLFLYNSYSQCLIEQFGL